jgi:hypothetical protein
LTAKILENHFKEVQLQRSREACFLAQSSEASHTNVWTQGQVLLGAVEWLLYSSNTFSLRILWSPKPGSGPYVSRRTAYTCQGSHLPREADGLSLDRNGHAQTGP